MTNQIITFTKSSTGYIPNTSMPTSPQMERSIKVVTAICNDKLKELREKSAQYPELAHVEKFTAKLEGYSTSAATATFVIHISAVPGKAPAHELRIQIPKKVIEEIFLPLAMASATAPNSSPLSASFQKGNMPHANSTTPLLREGKASSPLRRAILKWLSSLIFSCFIPRQKSKTTKHAPDRNIAKPSTPLAQPKMSSVLSSRSAEVRGLIGIPNTGNTCFMATAFQFIMNNEKLCEIIEMSYRALKEDIENTIDPSIYQQDALYQAYEALLRAIQDYRAGKPTDLQLLRPLLYSQGGKGNGTTNGLARNSMGDAEEFFLCILRRIPSAQYYNLMGTSMELGFIRGIERTFTLMPFAESYSQEKLQACLDRPQLQKEGEAWKIRRTDPDPTFILQLDLANSQSQKGQSLIDQTFSERPHSGMPLAGQEGWYAPISERNFIEGAVPQRLCISLKRFNPLTGQKNDAVVDMPEILKIQGQNYRLKTIGIHVPGHYYALVHKQGQWYQANDSQIKKVNVKEQEIGRKKGYLYFYEKA